MGFYLNLKNYKNPGTTNTYRKLSKWETRLGGEGVIKFLLYPLPDGPKN